MRKYVVISLLLILIGSDLKGFVRVESDTLPQLRPKTEHPYALFVLVNMINQYHYHKQPINDSISSVMFDNYFNSLDPSKLYFFEGDRKYFEKYRYQLDNDILDNNLDFGYQLFELYRERRLERLIKVDKMLDKEFDFTIDESIEVDYEELPWATNRQELDERWRKLLKNEAISYKLAGREWEDIQKSLRQRYDRVSKSVAQFNSEDVFQVYMNALTQTFDPHTDYFSPVTSQNFQIRMSRSLEGIGAQLTQRLDYTVVADIVPGGPASRSKQLQADDKIIGVAQGDEGDMVDVIGWRLDDVIQLIRGPKGTVVRLQLLKHNSQDGLPDTLRLVRDRINLEDESAEAELIPIIQGNETYNLGVITIPSFYENWEDKSRGIPDYKSTTRDVKNLIEELNAQGMDGLLIDLRYNGGGSLQEAIDLTGLFIDKGPTVQVRNTDESVDVLKDSDGRIYYNGPLSILTNRGSASSSEIFSGAIQDYKRGVVLGENSFGKGTVQRLIDLDRPVVSYISRLITFNKNTGRDVTELVQLKNDILDGTVKLGQLKITLAKFYRVTGSSTQQLGVAPDISFPTPYENPLEFGESNKPNALAWDEIEPANFRPANKINEELIGHLQTLYLKHLEGDPVLQNLVEEIRSMKKLQEENKISLNLESRRSETNDGDQDLSTDIENTEVFTTEENLQKLSDDPYLKESLLLLAELARKSMG